MDDIELLQSNSNACLSALEVALGIIDYKNKPKQQDRLKKFYIKLKLANTHKKKMDLSYIMLAMISDLEDTQLLNVVEKTKLSNAIKMSKDKKFKDKLICFVKKEGQDKVKVAKRFLSEFLNLEIKISKTNELNRNKKEAPKVTEIVIEPDEITKPVDEPKVESFDSGIIQLPETGESLKEPTDTLILPTENEMNKLLDTKVIPIINTDDIKPVIPTNEEVKEEPLKSVNELMDEILSKTYTSKEETKVVRPKEDVIFGIEDYINRNYRTIVYNHAIPYEDLEELRVLFPELRSYKSPYYNMDTIENLIETSCIIKSVNDNKYIDIETLMNLAINVHSLVTKRLLSYDMEKKNDEYEDARLLISYINLDNPIKVYEQAYTTFFNFYNGLSKEEQREICVSIERKMPYEYKNLFNIPDAIPYEISAIVNNAKLKGTINDTVKHEIFTNEVIRFDDLNNKEIPMLLAYATVYMDDKDVLEIYRALEEKNERAYKEMKAKYEYITKDQYDKIVRTSGKLQEWFASALTINKSREDSKLREDIKNPDLLEEHLIYMTRTILKEEPLFTRSTIPSRVKRNEEKNDVKDFFNSSRLKKVQVRVFNNWNKLPKLIILNGYDTQKIKKVG